MTCLVYFSKTGPFIMMVPLLFYFPPPIDPISLQFMRAYSVMHSFILAPDFLTVCVRCPVDE